MERPFLEHFLFIVLTGLASPAERLSVFALVITLPIQKPQDSFIYCKSSHVGRVEKHGYFKEQFLRRVVSVLGHSQGELYGAFLRNDEFLVSELDEEEDLGFVLDLLHYLAHRLPAHLVNILLISNHIQAAPARISTHLFTCLPVPLLPIALTVLEPGHLISLLHVSLDQEERHDALSAFRNRKTHTDERVECCRFVPTFRTCNDRTVLSAHRVNYY